MFRKKTTLLCLSALILTITVALAGCGRKQEEGKPVVVEQPVKPPPSPITAILPVAQPAISPVATNEPPKPLPPKPEDVNEVLARAYQKVVAPDTSYEPPFVVGDFNGDGSEDLAIAVKPHEEMLGEINNDLANWVLEDPRNISLPGALSNTQIPASERKPVQASKGDVMLAIVHGVGSQGWRNPEAKQTFLLKNGNANVEEPSNRKIQRKTTAA